MFNYSHDVNTYIIYTNIVIRFFNIKLYMYYIFYILINIKNTFRFVYKLYNNDF